jgi:hypothetical protein
MIKKQTKTKNKQTNKQTNKPRNSFIVSEMDKNQEQQSK